MSKFMRVALIIVGVGLILIGVAFWMGGQFGDLTQSMERMGLGETIERTFGYIRGNKVESGELRPIEGAYQIEASGITEITIDWSNGDIVIASGEVEMIEVHETGEVKDPDKYKMHWYRSGNTLKFTFAEKVLNFGFAQKKLEIIIPSEMPLEGVQINTMNSDIKIDVKELRMLKVDSMGGDTTVHSDVARVLYNSMAGNLEFYGHVDELRGDTMNGDLSLHLPEETGFVLEHSAMSGKVLIDVKTRKVEDNYYYGDEKSIIRFETMNGDISIKKLSR